MSKNNSETVTISKAEYEYLTGLKDLEKHCAQLESELNWLKEKNSCRSRRRKPSAQAQSARNSSISK